MANKIQTVVRMKPIQAPVKTHHWHWNENKPRQLSQQSPGEKTETLWNFDHIYSMASNNKDIFQTSVARLVLRALQGFNVSVFALGQTSSGKTYTMMGGGGEAGIIEQAVRYIELNKGDRDVVVSCFAVQIYNNNVYELLPLGLPTWHRDYLPPALSITDVPGQRVAINGVRKSERTLLLMSRTLIFG